MSLVLVTGATGNVGSEVVAALRRRGVRPRAFVRDLDAARRQLGDAELVRGDFGDIDSIRVALRGCGRLFLACSNHPRQVEWESNAIRAAAQAGVAVVKLSAAGARAGSPLAFSDWQGRIEQALAEAGASGVPCTLLQPGFYMSNVFLLPRALRAGRLVAPLAGARMVMISAHDVGEAAAAVLTGPGHAGASYVLTGADAIGYDDAARELSAAAGRPITFAPVEDDDALAAMREEGLPEWFAENFVRLCGFLRQGAASRTTDTLRQLTGRDPQPFAAFAHDRAGWFAGRG